MHDEIWAKTTILLSLGSLLHWPSLAGLVMPTPEDQLIRNHNYFILDPTDLCGSESRSVRFNFPSMMPPSNFRLL